MNPVQQVVSKEQIEMQLRYAEVELACWIKHLEAHQARGGAECEFNSALWIKAYPGCEHLPVLERYIDTYKADYDAKAELIKLSLAKLQSNVDQLKQILLKIDQQVVVPGSFQV